MDDDMEVYFINCPQCGDDVDRMHEGYCQDCSSQNQSELDQHNREYDAWNRMTDDQRDTAIRRGYV